MSLAQLETNLTFDDRHTWSGRFEVAGKIAHDLDDSLEDGLQRDGILFLSEGDRDVFLKDPAMNVAMMRKP